MSLFSCLPWFATKAPTAPDPADIPPAHPTDDANDRRDRHSIATQLTACRQLVCQEPDARERKNLLDTLARAEHRFTQPPPNFADASRQIDVTDIRAYKLQRELAPVLDRLVPKLADGEIALDARMDALHGIAVALGGWPVGRSIRSALTALKAVQDKIPAPDRHRAVRQAVANGDAKGLAARLEDLQRRRPRPDPRALIDQTLRGLHENDQPMKLLTHAVVHGNADVAELLTRKLTSLRRARVIDARDQIDQLKQALSPEVLHQAAHSAHFSVGVQVCVDALCTDTGLQATSRRALPSLMTTMIRAAASEEAFPTLIAQMCHTRQGRALAAPALEDLVREGLLWRLCRGDAAVSPLNAYLRGLRVAAKTGALSSQALGRMLLAPGETGRPAIADARGQLRACMRRMLDEIDVRRLLDGRDLSRLRAAIGPA